MLDIIYCKCVRKRWKDVKRDRETEREREMRNTESKKDRERYFVWSAGARKVCTSVSM